MNPTAYDFKPLGDEIEAATVGHVGPMAERYVEAGIPFLRSQNIKPNAISFSDVKFIDEKFHSELRKSSLKVGDVVVVRTGYPGTAAVVTADMLPMNCADLVIITPGERVDSRYLASLLNSPLGRALVTGNTVGAAQQHFNVTTAKRIKLPLPSPTVQRKIAAILTAHDDLIENNRQRIALLEKMAEEIYREWFVRMRFPGHEHTQVHKGVPEGWDVGKLAEVARMVFGQSPPSEYYNQVEDGLPFHQGVGSYGDRFPVHNTYCSVDGRTAEAGSILFSVRAPVGRLNITDRKVILGRGLAGLNEKKGRNSYLWQLLKSSFSREDLIGNGAIFASVSKKELEAFPIFRPPEDLINKFEIFAAPFEEQITGLNSANKVLNTTRDLLLNRLISGKLRVDDLDIRFPPSMQDKAA